MLASKSRAAATMIATAKRSDLTGAAFSGVTDSAFGLETDARNGGAT
jgi:hypothetical protein